MMLIPKILMALLSLNSDCSLNPMQRLKSKIAKAKMTKQVADMQFSLLDSALTNEDPLADAEFRSPLRSSELPEEWRSVFVDEGEEDILTGLPKFKAIADVNRLSKFIAISEMAHLDWKRSIIDLIKEFRKSFDQRSIDPVTIIYTEEFSTIMAIIASIQSEKSDCQIQAISTAQLLMRLFAPMRACQEQCRFLTQSPNGDRTLKTQDATATEENEFDLLSVEAELPRGFSDLISGRLFFLISKF